MAEKKKMSLALKVFIGLAAGVIVGLFFTNENAVFLNPTTLNTWLYPLGNLVFMNLLKFIVVPIVLFSITAGMVSLKDIRKVGSIGGKTIIYYLCTTAFAVTIGLIISNLFKGAYVLLDTTGLEFTANEAPHFWANILAQIFPANAIAPFANAAMLQVILIALFLGFAIIAVGEKAAFAVNLVESLNEVFMKIMSFIISLSPYGVFCLIAPIVAINGPKILTSLGVVLGAAYIAYIIHAAIVYSGTVRLLGGMNPLKFFKGVFPAMMLAFSSASSVGTLPMTMECSQKMGARKDIANFTLPLGATINMDGTAIYQGLCAIFIATCYGMSLTFPQMLTIVLTATAASIGTAGVPGAGMVMLAMVLTSVGVPIEGIAIVAGVDRIFDMGRTTLNITGDAACSIIITKMEEIKEVKKAKTA